jgi:hypothetical protein
MFMVSSELQTVFGHLLHLIHYWRSIALLVSDWVHKGTVIDRNLLYKQSVTPGGTRLLISYINFF